MNLFATTDFDFDDFEIHLLKEFDIPSVIDLFRLNYGSGYISPTLYDEVFYKRAIYGDDIIWLVLRDKVKVIASGAVDIGYGGNNDQIGMLSRLVVHPQYQRMGLARRIIKSLTQAAGDNIEYACGEARTAHMSSQILVEHSGFSVLGIYPHQYILNLQRESTVIYGQLCGNGQNLRRDAPPVLIPEASQLARHVLLSMKLSERIVESTNIQSYPFMQFHFLPFEYTALAELIKIKRSVSEDQPIFGNVTIDYGRSAIRRRKIAYHVALDTENQVSGAVGYKLDRQNRSAQLIELIAPNEAAKNAILCAFLNLLDSSKIDLIEANLSTYEAGIQRTFYDLGFRPVAYQPSMVYHKGERLDVLKMVKLNVPYDESKMKLTESARQLADIVGPGFRNL